MEFNWNEVTKPSNTNQISMEDLTQDVVMPTLREGNYAVNFKGFNVETNDQGGYARINMELTNVQNVTVKHEQVVFPSDVKRWCSEILAQRGATVGANPIAFFNAMSKEDNTDTFKCRMYRDNRNRMRFSFLPSSNQGTTRDQKRGQSPQQQTNNITPPAQPPVQQDNFFTDAL